MKVQIISSAAVLAAAIGIPVSANASNIWHEADTEIGYTIHMDHADSGKTRNQVVAELATAKADKRQWGLTYLNLAKPGWAKQGSTRTRKDVVDDLRAMTATEKARLAEIYTPG